MVIRLFILILFFIFACANYERDNIYDTEMDDPTYGLCDGSDEMRYLLETQFCSGYTVYDLCNGSKYELYTQRCNKSLDIIETRCGDDWYDAANVNLRCENNVVKTKCGSSWYDASDANLRCENNVVETVCGSSWYNAEIHFCYNGRIGKEKCGDRWEAYDTTLYECKEVNKIYLKTTVSYGGKGYKAVLIGDYTWMTENLNYATTAGSVCYDNDTDNCTKYGRLYSYDTALVVCPIGWHLPSNEEWDALKNSGYIDAYGFAAVSGGFGFPKGIFFDGLDEYGGWWSTEEGEDVNLASYLHYDGENVYFGISDKSMLFNVRCVKDYK